MLSRRAGLSLYILLKAKHCGVQWFDIALQPAFTLTKKQSIITRQNFHNFQLIGPLSLSITIILAYKNGQYLRRESVFCKYIE